MRTRKVGSYTDLLLAHLVGFAHVGEHRMPTDDPASLRPIVDRILQQLARLPSGHESLGAYFELLGMFGRAMDMYRTSLNFSDSVGVRMRLAWLLLCLYGPDAFEEVKELVGPSLWFEKLMQRKTQTIERHERRQRLDEQYSSLKKIIGESKHILDVCQQIIDWAPANLPVLITGETGTGKELVAGALHDLSPRKAKAFVPVNCAAIAESLSESELFGHKKGAFTGALAEKKGLIEAAHEGTLFLDEIGELSLNLQAKLLRVLDSGH
jgi:hypothetical protein